MNPRSRVVLLAMAVSIVGAACAPGRPEGPPPAVIARARPTAAVQVVPLPPLVLAGTTTTTQRIDLSFRTGGVVQQVVVNEGERVKRGQVLARLDPTELGAGLKQAEEGLERAKRTAERARVLAEGRAGNRSDAEDAATAVAVAAAQVESARFVKDRAVITAPVDGRIERRLVDSGEIVGAGQPLLVLAAGTGTKTVTVTAPVDDKSLRFIDVGATATAVIDGVDVAGVVTRLGSAAGVAGQIAVELRFENAPRELPTNVPVRVLLSTGRSALAVPALAVIDADDSGRGRLRVAGDVPRSVGVRVLAVDEAMVFVDVVDGDAAVTSVLLPTL
jgi:multidrug efflux system membrane fusion protein